MADIVEKGVLAIGVLVAIPVLFGTIASLSITSALSFFVFFSLTIKNDFQKLANFQYWIKMGLASVIGAIPVTVGYLSNAMSGLLAGSLFSCGLWIFAYFWISGRMDEIRSQIMR